MSFRSSRKAIRFLQSLEDARQQHRAAAEEQNRAESKIRVAESDLRAAEAYNQSHAESAVRAAAAYNRLGITDIDSYQYQWKKARKYEIQQKLLKARSRLEEYEPYKETLFGSYHATYQETKKKIHKLDEELSRIEQLGRADAGGSTYAEDSRHAANHNADRNHPFGGGGIYQDQKEEDHEQEKHIAREAEEIEALNVVQPHKHDEPSTRCHSPVTQLNHKNIRNGERDDETYVVSGREVDVSHRQMFQKHLRFRDRLKLENILDALPRDGRYFASNLPTSGLGTHNDEAFRAANTNAVQEYLREHNHSWKARCQLRRSGGNLGGMMDSNGAVVRSPIVARFPGLCGNGDWLYHDENTVPRLPYWHPFKAITLRGKNLRIVIDHSYEVARSFAPGETIRGRVVFSTTDNCILTNASISLWGQTMARFSIRSYGQYPHNHTYFEHIDLIRTRYCRLISQPTTVEAGQLYEWPFQFVLPQTTEYLRTNSNHGGNAVWYGTEPHRLPPSMPGMHERDGIHNRHIFNGVLYGLDAEVDIKKSHRKHLRQSMPIVVSSWLDENSTSPVLTTRYPLGQWQRWNGPSHQRLFTHFGTSSGSVPPVVDFGAFTDVRLPCNMTEPMSMALSVRHNQSLITADDSPPRLILVEVHLKLQEHWRERVLVHTMLSDRRILGTFHNDTYSHVLPADGTPLMLINNMSFRSFTTQSDIAILPTFKSYLRSHVFGLVVEAKIRHQLSGHIFNVATEVEWDITATAGSGLASGTAPKPMTTVTDDASPPSNPSAEVVQLTSSSGYGSAGTTAATPTSRAAAASGATATSSTVSKQAFSNSGPIASASTTSISSISGSSDSGSSAEGASNGMTPPPPLPTAKLSKSSGAANASSHALSAASSTASINSGVIGGGRSRSTSVTAADSSSRIASMARSNSGSRDNSASRSIAAAGSQTKPGSAAATSTGAVEKSLGSTLRRSKRSSSPVTAARTIERIFKHKIDDGVSDHKTAGKASKESVVPSKPAGQTTEVATEVVST